MQKFILKLILNLFVFIGVLLVSLFLLTIEHPICYALSILLIIVFILEIIRASEKCYNRHKQNDKCSEI